MNDGIPPLLRLSDQVAFLPIVNGSGPFTHLTRRWLLEHSFDAVAIPLPPSFQREVEAAVLELPIPSIVLQRSVPQYRRSWDASGDPAGNSDPARRQAGGLGPEADEFLREQGLDPDRLSP
ncbi:MAG: hypothetical protein AAF958_13490, partial [Planctomycetota bacterium]